MVPDLVCIVKVWFEVQLLQGIWLVELCIEAPVKYTEDLFGIRTMKLQ